MPDVLNDAQQTVSGLLVKRTLSRLVKIIIIRVDPLVFCLLLVSSSICEDIIFVHLSKARPY